MKKLVLIDGSNLIFRAYYASERQEIKTADGREANAIKTLIGMLNKIIKDEKPSHLMIALDPKDGTFRHDLYAEYKAGRSETPQRLREQFPMAMELYDAMGIVHMSVANYEADDIIATLATRGVADGFNVKIVSGDKDLLQLVNEQITVFTPKMGFSKECNYTPEEFHNKFDFTPDRFIEYKALVGDSSDNIIGVAKIGDKTARKLINEYSNVEEMVNAAQAGTIKGVVGANLSQSLEVLNKNKHLVTLVTDMELDLNLNDIEFDTLSTSQFVQYLNELGFSKIASEFSNQEIESEITAEINFEFEIITEFNADVHCSEQTFIYTQTLHENYLNSPQLGVGFASDKGVFYIEASNLNEQFFDWLASDSLKVTYNLKRMQVMFANHEINNVVSDLFLALSLIDVTNYKKTFNDQFAKYAINYLKTFEQVYLIKSNPKLPELELQAYDIASKAKTLFDCYLKICNEIEIKQLEEVLYKIELPLSAVLAQMEIDGIYLNQTKLDELTQFYGDKLDEIAKQIAQITDINIASPLQLSKYFFDEDQQNLPSKGIKKTARGFSTDIDNLLKLQANLDKEDINYQLIDLIIESRTYTKLRSTYLLGLKNQIHADGRVHPIYHQLLSETGRLSTQDPSIQNIPIRSEEGQVIRSLFSTNDESHKILAIDYSQVELRVMAHLSGDENMRKAFVDDKDIHSETAIKMFGEASKANRSKSKAINFGIIYGMSKYGLAKQVGITNEEADLFITKYFEQYPKVRDFIAEQIKFAQDNGYTKTITNRRRDILRINEGSYMEIEHAKRTAINTPIQSSAADLIKIAMLKVQEYIRGKDIKMIMQIHDELVFEVDSQLAEVVANDICQIMENAMELAVPLKANWEIGNDWLEAK